MITIDFQGAVRQWMLECFGKEILNDTKERNFRFFEESSELVQSCGMSREEAHRVIDYVFDRDIGEREQEVGGVLVCLSALCTAHGLGMVTAGNKELQRAVDNTDKIRAKHAAKPVEMKSMS